MCKSPPNPLASLNLPTVLDPMKLTSGGVNAAKSLVGGGGLLGGGIQNATANSFGALYAKSQQATAAQSTRDEQTILGQMGRGVLDTTILGQQRRSSVGTNATLGGN